MGSSGTKIKSYIKHNVGKIIGWIVLAVMLAFCGRVLIWEHFYYQEKEGSERAEVISNVATPAQAVEVDETEITEDQKSSYIVPASYPRFLSIGKLGVDRARVIPVGLDAESRLETPNNIFDVGWYTSSAKPGTGGTVLIDGHNGGPTMIGVFKNLPSLVNGDIIELERGDGLKLQYRVVENVTVPLSESDAKMSDMLESPAAGEESLSLITCTGEWSQTQQTYLSRQFLRAVLVR